MINRHIHTEMDWWADMQVWVLTIRIGDCIYYGNRLTCEGDQMPSCNEMLRSFRNFLETVDLEHMNKTALKYAEEIHEDL